MIVPREWLEPGSWLRVRLGTTAALICLIPTVLLGGFWAWLFPAPILWAIWGAGWRQRAAAVGIWGAGLLLLILYPLLSFVPVAFLLVSLLWMSFYLLLGIALVSWGRGPAGDPLAQLLNLPVAWLGITRIYALQMPPGDFWTIPAIIHPWPGAVVGLLGSWGLSAFMLLIASSAALLFTSFRRGGAAGATVTVTAIATLVLLAPKPVPGDQPPIRLALIQGDFALPWEVREALLDTVIAPAYLEIYRDVASESDLVVGPEYALPVALDGRPDLLARIQAAVDSHGAALVIGAEGVVAGRADRFYNMAWLFQPGTPPQGRATPFPVPYTIEDMEPGPEPASFDAFGGLGVFLCYDFAVPQLTRSLGRDSELLLLVTNQQAFDGTPAKRLMRGLTRLRAAEAGRFMAISANTGPTGIIDPRGRVLGWAPPGRRVVKGTIQLTGSPTWYLLYGYRVIWIAWGVALATMLLRSRQRPHSGSTP
jgi:apolipoprotein N-acyltransferase